MDFPEVPKPKLPDKIDTKLKDLIIGDIQSLIIYREEAFASFPELQRIWDDEVKDIIFTGITETFMMLGLSEEHLPKFFIYSDRDVEPMDLPPNAMWVSGDGQVWGINYDKVWRMSNIIKNRGNTLSFMTRGELLRIVAHESFHLHDIYFVPERAKEAAEVNKKTDLTNLSTGENAANIFGFHYRDLYDQREMSNNR